MRCSRWWWHLPAVWSTVGGATNARTMRCLQADGTRNLKNAWLPQSWTEAQWSLRPTNSWSPLNSFFTNPRDVQASSLMLQSMRLLAQGRRQDSVYIVAVLCRTSMVEPPAMLDVGLCSAAIPDTAVPCGLLCWTRSASQEHTRWLRWIRWKFSSTECALALRAHPFWKIEVCES